MIFFGHDCHETSWVLEVANFAFNKSSEEEIHGESLDRLDEVTDVVEEDGRMHQPRLFSDMTNFPFNKLLNYISYLPSTI
jgi:hypothetical protein